MEEKILQEYIKNITKASTYFIFKNGPVKKLQEEGKLTAEEVKEMQVYMQNHLAYLYNVLLEENNLKKFDLVVGTMNNFYVNDNENIELSHKNNNFPLKISEYSNYKIDNFIKSLYTNNSEQSEINKKIGNFCSKLNIRQFQYFIDSIVLYHTNNNLSFNRDDKKNIALNILTILLENKINNYEEYRNILIYSISGYSKLNTTLSYKLNNNANKYDEER